MTTNPTSYYQPRKATPPQPIPVVYGPPTFLEKYGQVIVGAIGLIVFGASVGIILAGLIVFGALGPTLGL